MWVGLTATVICRRQHSHLHWHCLNADCVHLTIVLRSLHDTSHLPSQSPHEKWAIIISLPYVWGGPGAYEICFWPWLEDRLEPMKPDSCVHTLDHLSFHQWACYLTHNMEIQDEDVGGCREAWFGYVDTHSDSSTQKAIRQHLNLINQQINRVFFFWDRFLCVYVALDTLELTL